MLFHVQFDNRFKFRLSANLKGSILTKHVENTSNKIKNGNNFKQEIEFVRKSKIDYLMKFPGKLVEQFEGFTYRIENLHR